jgi:heat shock protein HslJ
MDMNRKYWYLIIGGAILLALILIRACQPIGSATATPSAPTSVPTIANTATMKPLPTNTTAPQPQSTATTVPTKDPIQGINWQWVSVTVQTTGEVTYVPNPAVYTIVFHPDGTVTGQADCNSFNGTYSNQGGLTIKIKSSTRAACGEGSLDQEYLTLLDQVVAGGPDGTGRLALENAGGEKRMLFQNGGSAP